MQQLSHAAAAGPTIETPSKFSYLWRSQAQLRPVMPLPTTAIRFPDAIAAGYVLLLNMPLCSHTHHSSSSASAVGCQHRWHIDKAGYAYSYSW
jgi:hypothetical protein